LNNSNALQNIAGTIALAGAGKMGGAMLTGWLAQGLDAKRVVVFEPAPSAEIAALAARGARLNPKDAGAISTLVIAVKPQSFREAGATLKSHVAPATLVVSIMAGTTIKSLQETVGGAVVRAMPNTPAAIGRGITVAVADKGVSAAQRATADALLRATGAVEWVDDEGLMDAVTAVSGSGPAYIFLLAEELARARNRRRLRRALASLRSCRSDAAPERDLAGRDDGRSTGGADGQGRACATDDACDRRGYRALEGIGEVKSRQERMTSGIPTPSRPAAC